MIYLLEDDDSIRKLVLYGLDSQGFQSKGFALPSEFWRAMDTELPELVLLDIMLPEEDGLSILKKLRARPATKRLPIIMLTAKNSEYDRVIGLDHGADDFVSKPFSMLELIARIRAVLRRAEPAQTSGDFSLGLLFVSPDRHEVKVGGKDVMLTNKEFELLCLLLRNKGIVLSSAKRAAISRRCAASAIRSEVRICDGQDISKRVFDRVYRSACLYFALFLHYVLELSGAGI